MFSRFELASAVLVCAGAAAVSPQGNQTALVPVGFLAGLAAVRSPTYSDAVIRGARAGALGGVLFVTLAGVLVAARWASLVGYLFAVDVFLFTGFAMMVMVVPLYGIEGVVAGPLVHWIEEKAGRVVRDSRSNPRRE